MFGSDGYDPCLSVLKQFYIPRISRNLERNLFSIEWIMQEKTCIGSRIYIILFERSSRVKNNKYISRVNSR